MEKHNSYRAMKTAFQCFLVLCLGIYICSAQPVRQFNLLAQTDRSVDINFKSPQYLPRSIIIDGRAARLFEGKYATTLERGVPQLPVCGTLIALPPDASTMKPTLEIIELQQSSESGGFVAPTPREHRLDSLQVRYSYEPSPAVYNRNAFYPDQIAALGSPTLLRHQRVVNLTIHPLQYNPVTGEIKRVTKLVVRIHFGSTANLKMPLTQHLTADPAFEELYRETILNASQAATWQIAFTPRTTGDSLRDWFRPYPAFAKLSVVNDGIYAMTGQQLRSAGIPLDGVDPRTIKVFYCGKEIPILVKGELDGKLDSADVIEFYGLRNRGANGAFLSEYTDTNAYWLAWGSGNGVRMTAVQNTTDTSLAPVPVYNAIRHFEQDQSYYAGIDDENINDIRRVPSEGWYWTSFYPGGGVAQFPCSLPDVDPAHEALLRIHLGGMTGYFSTPDHRSRISVNGTVIGTVEFNGNRDTIAVFSIPAHILLSGTNMIGIESLVTTSDPNEFYLDWFEIEGDFSFVAHDNSLAFSCVPGPARYVIGGITDSTVSVYDLTAGRTIENITVAQSSTNFQVSFNTNENIPHQFIVIGESAKKVPVKIEQKIFKDIRANSSGADYIIITHSAFRSAADRLAQQRHTENSFRTAVIDVQDIYDEFNYGIFAPEPIKDFIRYAYSQWSLPAPVYIVMFGDAIWDFRHLFSNTVKTNFVPAYGYPPTDNWYVSFDQDEIIPSLYVGRIPVENLEMANDYVDKLVEYDHYQLGNWNKRFLFISGGNTDVEKHSFDGQSMDFIGRFVVPPPIAGIADTIMKTTSSVVDGEHKDRIRAIYNEGVVFSNFIGHSGGRFWAVDAGDPATLQNAGKYVFGSSVSCNVGFFADNRSNVYSEDFIFAHRAGAIAFWAGAGFSSYSLGSVVTEFFLSGVAKDTLRDLGKLTTLARIGLWTHYGPSDKITPGINLYPLLGDPATQLAIPRKPDLEIASSDIRTEPVIPIESDSAVTVFIRLRNFGLATADSVQIHVSDLYQNATYDLGTISLPPVGYADSLVFPWRVKGKAGSHLLTVTIDPANLISEVWEDNNIAALAVMVAPTSLSPLSPLPYGVVPAGPVQLRVTNPPGDFPGGLQFLIEVDTSNTFSSSQKISSPPVPEGVVATGWNTQALQPGIYYWRARTYDGSAYGAWMNSAFTVSSTIVPNVFRWQQQFPFFGGESVFSSTIPTDSGAVLVQQQPTKLFYRALGARDNTDKDYYTIARIDNQTITAYWWEVGGGFIVVDVDGKSGNYRYGTFDNYSEYFPDSMVTYLESIPTGHYVMMGTIYRGKTNVSEALYQEIEKLGSTMIRQVVDFDAWCFIGKRTSGGGTKIAEEHSQTDSAVVAYEIPNIYRVLKGSIESSQIGPVRQWSKVTWSGTAQPSVSGIMVQVLGDRGTSIDTLFTSRNAMDSLDIHTVDPHLYPKLRLLATLESFTGDQTPRFSGWHVDFMPPPDLAIGSQTVKVSADTVTEGNSVDVDLDVYNIGNGMADSIKVRLIRTGLNNVPVIVDEKIINTLPPLQSQRVHFTLSTAGITGRQQLKCEVQSLGVVDQYEFNNIALAQFTVRGDSLQPNMAVTFDGVEIVDGDYVRPAPQILVTMNDNTMFTPADTSTISIALDTKRIPYANNLSLNFTPLPSGGAQVLFTPTLSNGDHTMKIEAHDIAGNNADNQGSRTISFVVQGQQQLLNVLNFPNPFATETYFTFNYTGSQPPEEASIKIFTVAGRLIRSIKSYGSDLRIGFNRIAWDGRDNEGDEIGNGVYFYILSVRAGDQTDQVKGTVAKVR
ncbi:MAG: C25 family cysteine peptidase [Bacteroidota bacterium]